MATWSKDKPDGDLTQTTLEALKTHGAKLVDLKEFHDQFNLLKTPSEQKNQKVASQFTSWTFTRIIEEVEDIIEDKKQVRHSQIQKRIEACLDSDQTMASFKQAKCPHADASFLDYSLPVMIQSGGDFSIHKFQVDSSQEKLQSQAIYINVCGKYCDMSAMASRTLIVNPKDE